MNNPSARKRVQPQISTAFHPRPNDQFESKLSENSIDFDLDPKHKPDPNENPEKPTKNGSTFPRAQ